MKKVIILIVFLISGTCLIGQSAAKKLLLSDSGCPYGNPGDYTYHIEGWNYYSSTSCGTINISSLATARQVLDNIRNSVNCGSSYDISGMSGYCKSLTVNNYVLHNYNQCELYTSPDAWVIAAGYSSFTVGNTPIIHIVNGVITYIEYY